MTPMPPKSIEELDEVRRRCKAMLKRRAAISGGASLIPVPGLDFAADVGMLLELIPAINRKFGLSPEQIEDLDAKHKTLVYAMIKKVGTDLVGRYYAEAYGMCVMTTRMFTHTGPRRGDSAISGASPARSTA